MRWGYFFILILIIISSVSFAVVGGIYLGGKPTISNNGMSTRYDGYFIGNDVNVLERSPASGLAGTDAFSACDGKDVGSKTFNDFWRGCREQDEAYFIQSGSSLKVRCKVVYGLFCGKSKTEDYSISSCGTCQHPVSICDGEPCEKTDSTLHLHNQYAGRVDAAMCVQSAEGASCRNDEGYINICSASGTCLPGISTQYACERNNFIWARDVADDQEKCCYDGQDYFAGRQITDAQSGTESCSGGTPLEGGYCYINGQYNETLDEANCVAEWVGVEEGCYVNGNLQSGVTEENCATEWDATEDLCKLGTRMIFPGLTETDCVATWSTGPTCEIAGMVDLKITDENACSADWINDVCVVDGEEHIIEAISPSNLLPILYSPQCSLAGGTIYPNGACIYDSEFGVCSDGVWASDGDLNEGTCAAAVSGIHGASSANSWQPGVGCCGDDADDLGSVIGEFLCSRNQDGTYGWVAGTAGLVRSVDSDPEDWLFDGTNYIDINGALVADYSYVAVSDDVQWHSCDAEGIYNNFGGLNHTVGSTIEIEKGDGGTYQTICIDGTNITGVDSASLGIETSERGSEAFADCLGNSDQIAPDIHKELQLGDYAYGDNAVYFCAGSPSDSFFTDDFDSDINALDACGLSQLPYDKSGDPDDDLDKMSRTGKYCCGDDFYQGFFDTSIQRFEYYSDPDFMNQDLTRIACWNNRPVYNASTSETNIFGQPINLLRNSIFFPYNEGNLPEFTRNWIVSGNAYEFDAMNDEFRLTFSDLSEAGSVQIETEYPVHLTPGATYDLNFSFKRKLGAEADYLLNVFVVDVTNDQRKTYIYPVDTSEKTEIIEFTAVGELYSFTFNYTTQKFDTFTLSKLSLHERPVAVADEGQLYICTDKDGGNPVATLQNTQTDTPIADSTIPYCIQEVGEHVCNPNGYWEAAVQSNDAIDTLSVSPNIIEDSDLNYGYFFDGVAGCEHIINYDENAWETIEDGNSEVLKRYGASEMNGNTDYNFGDKYMACSFGSFTDVSITDSDGSQLGAGEYIFSAWVNGTGSLRMRNADGTFTETPFSLQDWQRIEVQGSINAGEDVVVGFSGNFAIDGLQLERKHADQFERGRYFATTVRRSCCNGAYECWNGHECVDMGDDSGNSDGNIIYNGAKQLDNAFAFGSNGLDYILNDGEAGYLCFGGSYEYTTTKYRWNTETDELPEFGFCESGSCFVGDFCSDTTPFCTYQQVNRTNCVANGDSFYGYECKDGQWSSNVEYLASGLETFAETTSGEYGLYCGDYHHVLNYYSSQAFKDAFDTKNLLDAIAKPLPGANDDSIRNVNKACLLLYNNGEKYVVGVGLHDVPGATTALAKVGDAYFNRGSCGTYDETEDRFHSCGGKVYYNPVKQLLIYGNFGIDAADVTTSSVAQSMWINTLVSVLEANVDSFDDSVIVNDAFIYREAMNEQHLYDELYIFDGAIGRIESTREKIINAETDEYTFLYLFRVPHIPPNQKFLDDYNILPSPNDPSRPITVFDVFDVSYGDATSYAVEDGGSVVAVKVSGEAGSSYYTAWPTFTGRLRGDVSLND